VLQGGGVPNPLCAAAAMPVFELQLPAAEVFHGAAVPAGVGANIIIDLFEIKGAITAAADYLQHPWDQLERKDHYCVHLTFKWFTVDSDLSSTEHLADTSAAGLSVLLALEDLDLSNCDSISDATLQSLSTLLALRTLELFDCNFITDIGLPLIHTHYYHVTMLWFSEAPIQFHFPKNYFQFLLLMSLTAAC
jgi:hypothetical protein